MSRTDSNFSQRLLRWFDQHGRKDLPWQENKTPYRVWVSEIMLQQTQVSAVIDYYQRFMARFPTIADLAAAEQDDVLEHWAGLGYYARARNLHKCAQIVTQQFNGEFPNSLDALITLPGIGRSTAGAIMSIAMQERGVILDGNVKRVLCRHQSIEGWPGKRETEKKLWALADACTPARRVDDYTQAIMDLGATLCTRSKPACDACPLNRDCLAFAEGNPQRYPFSKPKKKIPERSTWVTLLRHNDKILLEKRPQTGIWGGLYSLPEHDSRLSATEIVNKTEVAGHRVTQHHTDEPFWHTFSHFKLKVQPLIIELDRAANRISEDTRSRWFAAEEVKKVGLPAPISRYLELTITKAPQPLNALANEP